MTTGPGRQLTRKEFDAVIRRAAELAQSDPDTTEGTLSEAEVYRIAGDVGLGETHVRRALAEVRGGVTFEEGNVLDRIFGPATIHASRVVPGTPESLRKNLDDFFVASQLLEPVRRSTTVLQYRPAVDWASKLAQAASFSSKKHYVASARWIEVNLEPVDDARTMVSITVDPGTRGEQMAGAGIGGGVSAVAAGIGTTLLLTPVLPVAAAAVAALGVGGGVATGITMVIGSTHKRKLVEIRYEVEGILDRLESGETLEPPPPSWRRWVKRQFHGVAREFGRSITILDEDDFTSRKDGRR